MDFTRVTTSRLALCPAHTIATCRSCPETNGAFLRLDPSTPTGACQLLPGAMLWRETPQPSPCPGEGAPGERWEYPGSEGGTRSLATLPLLSGLLLRRSKTPSPTGRGPLGTTESQEEAPAWPEHRVSSARQAAHRSMISQGPSLPSDIPYPPCPCHHPPRTCAPSAAWGRPCGCSSRS